jgi:hypothetical protein
MPSGRERLICFELLGNTVGHLAAVLAHEHEDRAEHDSPPSFVAAPVREFPALEDVRYIRA